MTIAITRPEGCAGTLSFDALALVGSWQVGLENNSSGELTQEGHGVVPIHVVNDAAKRTQRSMTTTYNSNAVVFDMPAEVCGLYPYVYRTRLTDRKSGNKHPLHLELNGVTVWSSADLAIGEEVKVEFDATAFKPGLNELTWRYDTMASNNWLVFDYHQLALDLQPSGIMLIVR